MSSLRTIFLGGPPPPPFFAGTKLPGHYVISLDDEQVKTIAHQYGLGVLFQPLEKPTTPGLGSAIGYILGTHPTHWLFFEKYEFWPKDSDNGYVMRGWPKSRTTKEEFSREVMDIMGKVCIGEVMTRKTNERPDS